MQGRVFLKKNQNAPRPSEHPPVMGKTMSKRLYKHRIHGKLGLYNSVCYITSRIRWVFKEKRKFRTEDVPGCGGKNK